MSDHKRKLTTQIRWGKFGCDAAVFLLLLICYAEMDIAQDNPGRIVLLVILIGFFVSAMIPGIHYTITYEGIIVKWLNIPLRKIRWAQVEHAEYLHLWYDLRRFYTDLGKGPKTGQLIYVTLKGCPRYFPMSQHRAVHNRLHPFRAMTIWLARDTKHIYIDFFKECYPNLKMQPVDNEKKY